MLIRTMTELESEGRVISISHGKSSAVRLLTKSDGVGFSVSEARASAGESSDLWYTAEGRKKSPWVEALGAASLSYGQLAIILIENRSVSALIDVLRKPATFATMNPLLEYHYLKKSDLI